MQLKFITRIGVSLSLLIPGVVSADPNTPMAPAHKYFVGMFAGIFESETVAISAARLPPGTKLVAEFPAEPGQSKIVALQMPRGTTDAAGDLAVLIIEPVKGGAVKLWLSGTDLAREDRRKADADVINYGGAGEGGYRVFERK